MADTNTIIQKITIEGGKEIEASLKAMGKTGEDAFNKINQAANNTNTGQSTAGIENLVAATGAAGVNAEETAAHFTKLRGALDIFGSTSAEAAKEVHGVSRSAADAISGVRNFASASDQAGAAVGATDVSVIRLAQTLRLLSKAAGIRPLGQFARTLGIVGRAAELAGPALFLSFLEKMADAAAKAADKVADLAAKNKVSSDSFQEFAAGFTAVGLGVEDAGKTFSEFTNIIKETREHQEKGREEFAKYSDQVEETRFKLRELTKSFNDLDRESFRTMRDLRIEQRDFLHDQSKADREFSDSLADIQQQRQEILSGGKLSPEEQRAKKLAALDKQEQKLSEANSQRLQKALEERVKLQEKEEDAIRKQNEETFKLLKQQRDEEKQLKEQQKAHRKAIEEEERHATVLEKLSINVLDNNAKLLKTPEVLQAVADALRDVTDETKKEKLENELVASGLDRHFLPTYRKGAAAVKALNEEGKRIRPKFSEKDNEIADELLVKIGQVESAIGTLRNILGLNVAPSFTNFFNRLKDIFVDLQDPIRNLGFFINEGLTPVLDGLATALGIVVDGIGGLINALTTLINGVFGTSLESAQVFVGILFALAVIFGGLPIKIILATAAIGQFFDKVVKFFGLGDFGKQILSTLAIVTLAFTFFGARIIGIFVGIRLFVSALIGSFLPFAPVLAVIGIAALALFAIWKNWDVLKEPVMKAFNDISNAAGKFWEDFKTGWANFIRTIAPLWDLLVVGAKFAFQGLQLVFDNILVPVFEGIKKGFLALVDFINDVSGKKFTPTTIAIGVLIGILAGLAFAFAPVTTAILILLGVGAFLLGFFKDNKIALIALGVIIGGLLLLFAPWTTAIGLVIIAVGFLISKWDAFKKGISDIMNSVQAKLDGFAKYLAETWIGKIAIAIGQALGLFGQVGFAANKLPGGGNTPEGNPFQGIIQVLDDNGAPVERAKGGSVWGRGSATSDSIPAWLSDGEFVTQTKAVNYYGRGFMHAINEMRLPKDFFRGFNLGGLVDGMTRPGRTRFATGGAVVGGAAPLHPVHLHLGGGQVIAGLLAPDKVAESLMRVSINSQLRSAGRKPTYYGKGR